MKKMSEKSFKKSADFSVILHLSVSYRSASTVIASQLVDNDVWWQWGLRIVPPFCLATIILLIFLLEVR